MLINNSDKNKQIRYCTVAFIESFFAALTFNKMHRRREQLVNKHAHSS